MRDVTRVYGLFHIFYAASRDRFLRSHVSNHRVVDVQIVHETKGFSSAKRDKMVVRENNQIAKHLWIIFMLSNAHPFFSRDSHVFLISWTSHESSIAGLKPVISERF